jgi:leucyl aminopeptidase
MKPAMTTPLSIQFSAQPKAKFDSVVVFATQGNVLTPAAAAIDKESGGLVTAYLKRQKIFTGKKGQSLTLGAAPKQDFARIIVMGLGEIAEFNVLDAESLGGKLHAALIAAGAESANILIDAGKPAKKGAAILDEATLAAHIAFGASLATYKFDTYRSKPKKGADAAPELSKLNFANAAKGAAKFSSLQAIATGVHLARDLTNLPPNDLYPDSYAKRIKAELSPLGVKVEILDEKRMATLGFGAHLAVGQGSLRPPRVVIMHWNGTSTGAAKSKKSDAPVALVGKGITFDTGGISIKPAASMDDMKMDMGGSAAVIGTLKALALRKAKTNVVGIVALAENMPSDRAYRPGDIIKSLSGKTIEVLNTDAEGRLVLCDSLTYIQRTHKPKLIIDLATLTGAIIVALGHDYCGAFANNDDLWDKIDQAGKDTAEKYWRMPLDESFRKSMESRIADLKNLGDASRSGGACAAAGFLEAFIENDTPWAHLDIAGTAMGSKGGTGFAVRTLERLIADHYEG